jgi:hypothetical protein
MQSFTDLEMPLECGSTAVRKAQPGHTLILLLRSCELRRNTLWNEPQTCKNPLSRMKI